jgi:hypothetical protein
MSVAKECCLPLVSLIQFFDLLWIYIYIFKDCYSWGWSTSTYYKIWSKRWSLFFLCYLIMLFQAISYSKFWIFVMWNVACCSWWCCFLFPII